MTVHTPLRRLCWIVGCGLVAALAGCAVDSGPLGREGRNLELSLGRGRAGRDAVASKPAVALPPAMPPVESRAGSNLDPVKPTATGTASAAAASQANSSVDKRTLSEVLEQVQALGDTSPEEQQRLLADLKSTDPSLWPMLAQYSRIAAARRRAERGDEISQAAAPRRGSSFAAAEWSAAAPHPNSTPAHVGPADAAPPATAVATASGQAMAAARPDLMPAAVPGAAPVAASPVAPVAVASAAPPTAAPLSAAPPTPASTASPVTQASAVVPVAAPAFGVTTAEHLEHAPADFKGQLTHTIAALERETGGDAAADIERQTRLRMLYLLAGRKEDALRPIAGLPETQQAFWSNELFGLAAILDDDRQPDASRRAAEALTHLEQAQSRLRESGTLLVRNVAFCTEVRSYGITKPFETYQFAPGQEVLLYAELENFKSELTPQGHHTALKSSYEIVNGQGRRVAEHEFPLTEEHCRNPRRDFFIRYFLRLPDKGLEEGKHTLRLSIEDTLSQKVGQASIDFTLKRP